MGKQTKKSLYAKKNPRGSTQTVPPSVIRVNGRLGVRLWFHDPSSTCMIFKISKYIHTHTEFKDIVMGKAWNP